MCSLVMPRAREVDLLISPQLEKHIQLSCWRMGDRGGGTSALSHIFDKDNRKFLNNRFKKNTTIKTITSCVKVIFVAVTGSGTVRWKFVHGLFENAIYGGRIDNTFDAKVLQSYLLQYFEQAVFPGQVS